MRIYAAECLHFHVWDNCLFQSYVKAVCGKLTHTQHQKQTRSKPVANTSRKVTLTYSDTTTRIEHKKVITTYLQD